MANRGERRTQRENQEADYRRPAVPICHEPGTEEGQDQREGTEVGGVEGTKGCDQSRKDQRAYR